MAENKNNYSKANLMKYLYGFLPDFSYIDYFDRLYALGKSTGPLCACEDIPADAPKYQPTSYRCLIISPIELSVESIDELSFWKQLHDYDGRHVYVYVRGEDAAAECSLAIKPADTSDSLECDYIMELRF